MNTIKSFFFFSVTLYTWSLLAVLSQDPWRFPYLMLGTTHTHTHIVDVAPFILVSSDWEADGAAAVKLTKSASSVLRVALGQLLPRLDFFPRLGLFCFFYFVFYSCCVVCACVVVVSMQGIERHRKKESRRTWTNRQLILYKCTLYLFIVFSLELKSSVTGEKKKISTFTLFYSCGLKVGGEKPGRHLA